MRATGSCHDGMGGVAVDDGTVRVLGTWVLESAPDSSRADPALRCDLRVAERARPGVRGGRRGWR